MGSSAYIPQPIISTTPSIMNKQLISTLSLTAKLRIIQPVEKRKVEFVQAAINLNDLK